MDFKWNESQQHQTASQTDPYAAPQLYNVQQHSLAQYRYYPPAQSPNSSHSNPKHQTSSAQFDSAPSDSGLRPPGVDHLAPNPYLPHGGYEGQTAGLQYAHPQMIPAGAYFTDPAWATQAAFQQSVAIASAMMNPSANPTWKSSAGHLFGKGAMKKPKKVKVVQSAWCEVCNIECNSKDVLDKHKLGKKHKKNLEKIEEAKKEAAAAATVKLSNPAASKETRSGESGNATNGQAARRKGVPGAEVEDLETKRRKLMESGAAAESLRVCAICNVAVNSETVFNYHLAGQKHASQLKKLAAAAVAGLQAVTAS